MADTAVVYTSEDLEDWRDRIAAAADGPTLPLRLHIHQVATGPAGETQAALYYHGSCVWSPEANAYFGGMKPLLVQEEARLRREFWTDPYAMGALARRFAPGVLALVTQVLEGRNLADVARHGKVQRRTLKGWLRHVRAYVAEVLYPTDPDQAELARRQKARRTVYSDQFTYDDAERARAARFAAMTTHERDTWRREKLDELRAAS